MGHSPTRKFFDRELLAYIAAAFIVPALIVALALSNMPQYQAMNWFGAILFPVLCSAIFSTAAKRSFDPGNSGWYLFWRLEFICFCAHGSSGNIEV